MFNRQSIHIALLLWGCIFCLIAALCMSLNRDMDQRKKKYLMILMQLSCAILLASDAAAWHSEEVRAAGKESLSL